MSPVGRRQALSERAEKTRGEVLAVPRRHRGPLPAYDLLGELRDNNPRIAAPTIDRALRALTHRGRMHRLESLNACAACRSGHHEHASIRSICDDCGAVEESVAPDLLRELSSIIGKSGFAPMRHVIEIHGLCASCGAGQSPA